MKFNEFKEKIEEIYKEKFDQSLVECNVYRCLGKSITIDFVMAGSREECASGYFDNDMLNGCFMIHLPDGWTEEDDLPEKMTMAALKGYIRIKPEQKYLYCGCRKLPYRKTTGNAEKLIAAFGKFVDRLHEAVVEEYKNNNLLDKDMELVKSKHYAA